MEMEFTFELKKQSTCSVRLTNKTFHTVAFKVKTTSPKKYCVRPNVGIVLPNSTSEFTVTMQAQKVAPPNLICKDKFLIQSAIVPTGTTEKDITSVMFSKDDDKNVEEVKLRVIFVSPSQSPELSPTNREIKQAPFPELPMLKDPVSKRRELLNPPMQVSTDANNEEFKMSNGQGFFNATKGMELKTKNDVSTANESKLDAKDEDFKMINDQGFFPKTEVLELKAQNAVTAANESKDAQDEEIKVINGQGLFATTKNLKLNAKDMNIGNESKPANEAALSTNVDLVNTEESKLAKDEELKPDNISVYDEQLKPIDHCESSSVEDADRDVELTEGQAVGELKFVSDIQEMRSKLNVLELKFNEVESSISKLIEERRQSIHDRQILQQELEVLRKRSAREVQEGFPLLFVVMVALVSVVLGYFSHS
ncbi:hypothetical protein K2173_005961 [Erythroxylum novogranatense]|uniref:MSP domain-containing protein n=1 Tax=Erythroxylum novogranatense TaxID=1862640 RepID=A0AAV8TUZ9_9ROSI|nr:hypothetical protein K2173_005961 [Erythroxylum novogranatense]